MVAVAQPARGLMASLDLKSVVIGGEAGVRGRAPLHLDGEARCTGFAAVGATEVDGISPPGQAATGHRPSQASEEDLVVPGDWHSCFPRTCR